MKYNLLGNTGMLVSEIGLGTMTFGGLGEMKAGILDFPGTAYFDPQLSSRHNITRNNQIQNIGLQ